MCLPDFERFEIIPKENAITGYRVWRNLISPSIALLSENQNYQWKGKLEGPHEVKDTDSGIYAYNYYNNCNCYNYYNYILGIIKQYGKVAIHKTGYRSEYAKIDTLFSIRESDAPKELLSWIKTFNELVTQIAEKYEVKVISYQDYADKMSSLPKQ